MDSSINIARGTLAALPLRILGGQIFSRLDERTKTAWKCVSKRWAAIGEDLESYQKMAFCLGPIALCVYLKGRVVQVSGNFLLEVVPNGCGFTLWNWQSMLPIWNETQLVPLWKKHVAESIVEAQMQVVHKLIALRYARDLVIYSWQRQECLLQHSSRYGYGFKISSSTQILFAENAFFYTAGESIYRWDILLHQGKRAAMPGTILAFHIKDGGLYLLSRGYFCTRWDLLNAETFETSETLMNPIQYHLLPTLPEKVKPYYIKVLGSQLYCFSLSPDKSSPNKWITAFDSISLLNGKKLSARYISPGAFLEGYLDVSDPELESSYLVAFNEKDVVIFKKNWSTETESADRCPLQYSMSICTCFAWTHHWAVQIKDKEKEAVLFWELHDLRTQGYIRCARINNHFIAIIPGSEAKRREWYL